MGWLRRIPLWFLIPATGLLLVFFVVPFAYVFTVSLHKEAMSGPLTAENYLDFFSDPYNRAVLARTLWIGVIIVLLSLALAFPVARTLSRASNRARLILRSLIFFPLITSAVVRTFGWMLLLSDGGILNDILASAGIKRFHLMYTAEGIIIGLTQVLLPFMILTLSSALENIDPTLEHASRSLGASPTRTFFRVIIPLSVPGMIAGSLLVFALSISAFVTPALMGGPGTMVMSTLIGQNTTLVPNLSFAATISIILLIITIFIIAIYYRVASPLTATQSPAGE